MEGKWKKLKKTVIVLIIGFVVMILGSALAQTFNTSFYSVSVERISFETESGTLSGLLYLPKDVDEDNPAPTIVTTHGYLNSAEMQDAQAIEMSRRGYVVLALDMYDHGHSIANEENTGSFLSFWPTAIWDAVQYMYEQDYVLKDEDGNGIIAVSGHSMGGFSSTMALYYDELSYEATGIRMIYAGLSMGSDYSYTEWLGLDVNTATSMLGGRTVGKIAAHYDEFFFNAETTENTVTYKDYVSTEEGQIFLETISYDEEGNAILDESTEDGVWYETSDGGLRIIYEPNQIHPLNHFSMTTTGMMISFYETAFADYADLLNEIDSSNQIWMAKEGFELVAMIGFFMFVIALLVLLLQVPALRKANTKEVVPLKSASTLSEKVSAVSLFVITMLIPAVIYTAGTSEASNWLKYGAIIAIVLGIVALILAIRDQTESYRGTWMKGSVLIILAGILLLVMVMVGIPNNEIFQAVTTSEIVTWALEAAAISIIIMTAVYLFGKGKNQGIELSHYGISGNVMTVLTSFCAALIAVVVGYACVFLVDALFTTDFRFWTFAIKTFEPSTLVAALKYMPLFFIYYLVAGAGSVRNTNTEKLQGVRGYLLAMLTNMGGILLWLIIQYGLLFTTGTALYPAEDLSGILLMALVPTLAIASWLTKFLYKKTGNIWAAAFFNTMLMTMMTVANTTVYFQA